MVRAWYYHEDKSDPGQQHSGPVMREVSLDRLKDLGILYSKFEVGEANNNFHTPELEKLRKERGYVNYDIVNIDPSKMPNYEEKLKIFFSEHLHTDEEVRFILDGGGFFDIRDDQDHWIRIEVVKGDLIIVPAGIYHRFAPSAALKTTQAMRLFQSEPKWTPYNRGPDTDKLDSRDQFVKGILYPPAKFEVNEGVNGKCYILQDHAHALANYPHMREVNGMLYVSGTSSRRADNTLEGATVKSDGTVELDIAKQTRAVILNIKKILSCAGANLSHVVELTCYLTDMKMYSGYNKVYNEYFSAQTGPTRTTMAVKELPHPHIVIEIKCVAVVPKKQ